MEARLKAYIAGQVRALRRARGLTQDGLASAIGRTAEAISNIERGKSLPSLETLISIAEVLSVPARDLFPQEAVDVRGSSKRLRLEAEALTELRGLSDRQLEVAINQLRALAELN